MGKEKPESDKDESRSENHPVFRESAAFFGRTCGFVFYAAKLDTTPGFSTLRCRLADSLAGRLRRGFEAFSPSPVPRRDEFPGPQAVAVFAGLTLSEYVTVRVARVSESVTVLDQPAV